jgi:hypothetical protein
VMTERPLAGAEHLTAMDVVPVPPAIRVGPTGLCHWTWRAVPHRTSANSATNAWSKLPAARSLSLGICGGSDDVVGLSSHGRRWSPPPDAQRDHVWRHRCRRCRSSLPARAARLVEPTLDRVGDAQGPAPRKKAQDRATLP